MNKKYIKILARFLKENNLYNKKSFDEFINIYVLKSFNYSSNPYHFGHYMSPSKYITMYISCYLVNDYDFSKKIELINNIILKFRILIFENYYEDFSKILGQSIIENFNLNKEQVKKEFCTFGEDFSFVYDMVMLKTNGDIVKAKVIRNMLELSFKNY